MQSKVSGCIFFLWKSLGFLQRIFICLIIGYKDIKHSSSPISFGHGADRSSQLRCLQHFPSFVDVFFSVISISSSIRTPIPFNSSRTFRWRKFLNLNIENSVNDYWQDVNSEGREFYNWRYVVIIRLLWYMI